MIDEMKFKPCPFCGGEAHVENDFSDYSFIVCCSVCGAKTRTFMTGLDDIPIDDEIAAQNLAAEAWNRRCNS
jgi:Lar family restriction alleviation protein